MWDPKMWDLKSEIVSWVDAFQFGYKYNIYQK